MFLLNRQEIQRCIDEKNGFLEIHPFDFRHLGPTCYYFRLGPRGSRWTAEHQQKEPFELTKNSKELVLQPQEFVLIQSLEMFRCSSGCLGLIGASSTLVRRGLSLLHSPFIDPNFPSQTATGFLELGLKNEANASVEISLGDRLGKVAFFNVGDTYPVLPVRGTLAADDYARRADRGGRPAPLYDDHPPVIDDE